MMSWVLNVTKTVCLRSEKALVCLVPAAKFQSAKCHKPVAEFQHALNDFDKELRIAKRKHNIEKISSMDKLVNSRDPKLFWDEVNKLGVRKKKGVVCEALDSLGNITRDPAIVFNHWENEYRRLYSEAPTGEFDDTFYVEKLLELEESMPDVNPTRELNVDISLNEVKKAVLAGKNGKACGNDKIPYEALRNDLCVKLMHRLFNKCFEYGMIPNEWNNCLIVPISKGERSVNTQPLTFRGLALQSCLYKTYSYILNRRLDAYLESNELISDVQNGFRRGRNCVDHIYSLAETIRLNTGSPKNKVFACFVDLRRAFDEVDRNLLLLRLQNVGVNGRMYHAMCAVYKKPYCSVRLGDSGLNTNWIESNYGTLQGDVISPKNFSVMIDELLVKLNDSGLGLYYGPGADEKFSCLAFADDIVIVAPTKEKLQKLVDIVHLFCKRWRMTVNTSKTKTMVFRKNRQTKSESIDVKYGEISLEQVSSYKYLGVVFDEVLKFDLAQNDLAARGGRALGAIISKSKFYTDIGYKSYTKLIDTCVNSVTDYCAEMLGHETPKNIIDIQLRAARYHLGVNKFTTLCCLNAEMGWLPASYRRQITVLRYYNRLMGLDTSRIPRRVFESTVNTPNSWAWRTKDLMTSLGLTLYWNMGSAIPEELIQFYVKDSMKTEWFDQVGKKAKLRLYRQIKKTTCVSPYVAANIPRKHRSLIARLVTGNLPLKVETGRFENILLADRTCDLCGIGVEDEEHFLYECTKLEEVRTDFPEAMNRLPVITLIRKPFVFGRIINKLWDKRRQLLVQ